LKASQLKVRGTWIRDLEARFDARAGEIRLDPIRMEIFGGRVAGAVGLDLRGDLPRAEADIRTEHLPVGPLLREVARSDFLEGPMEGRWVLRANLGDREELKRSLEGWGEATVAQGALVGVDLVSIVRSLGLSGREPRSSQDRPKTPFSNLSARFAFSQGAVKVSQASMTASGLRITAEGQADLLEETLDFRLEPELGGGDPKKKGEEQSAALVVPVWVRGTFSRPKFRPDLGSVHTKGEGKLRLQIPSSKELKDLLKGLLDRK
jgi:AsmA protein